MGIETVVVPGYYDGNDYYDDSDGTWGDSTSWQDVPVYQFDPTEANGSDGNVDGYGGDGTALKNIKKINGALVAGNDTSGVATNSASEHLSSGYNAARKLDDGSVGAHAGIDIVPLNADGTVNTHAEALSIASGAVISVGKASGFGSHTVVIQMDDGHFLTYGHMSKADVTVGQHVSVGDPLGVVGNEGSKSHGLHLHIQESIGAAYFNAAGFQGYVDPGSH